MFSKNLFRNLIVMPETQWQDAIWSIRSSGLVSLATIVSIVMFAKVALAGIVDAHFIGSLKVELMLASLAIGAVLVGAEIIGLRRERRAKDGYTGSSK